MIFGVLGTLIRCAHPKYNTGSKYWKLLIIDRVPTALKIMLTRPNNSSTRIRHLEPLWYGVQVYLVDLAFVVIRHEVNAAVWELTTRDTDEQLSHVLNSLQTTEQ